MEKPFENKCISCGSDELDYDVMDIDGTTLVQNVKCTICGTQFYIYSETNWMYELEED